MNINSNAGIKDDDYNMRGTAAARDQQYSNPFTSLGIDNINSTFRKETKQEESPDSKGDKVKDKEDKQLNEAIALSHMKE